MERYLEIVEAGLGGIIVLGTGLYRTGADGEFSSQPVKQVMFEDTGAEEALDVIAMDSSAASLIGPDGPIGIDDEDDSEVDLGAALGSVFSLFAEAFPSEVGIYTPVPDQILAVIESDYEEGKGENIDHIMLSPDYFAALYLLGLITDEQIAQAEIDTTAVMVTVQGVEFGDVEYIVRTQLPEVIEFRFERPFAMATIAADGTVV